MCVNHLKIAMAMVLDRCEISGNDCNGNGIPDECDPDCDGDGLPTLAKWIAMPMAPRTTAKTSTAMPTVRLMCASPAKTATATAFLIVVS